MAKFMVCICSILLLSTAAEAGKISELSLMAIEIIEARFNFTSPDQYKVLSQKFVQPGDGDIAVETQIQTPAIGGQNQEWTCVSQFAKTTEFFIVLKTDCNL